MKQPIGNRLLAWLLVLVMAVSLTPAAWATDGTPDTNPPPATGTVTGVSLSTGTMALKVGETADLTATLVGATELPEGATVSWTSGDPNEVQVLPPDDKLTVQIKALKTAETNDQVKEVSITVTVKIKDGESFTATCNVTVSPSDPSGVVVTPSEVELAPTQTRNLTAQVTPTTADQSVTWKTANQNIAKVTETGVVTGVAAGTTRITARAAASGLEDYCEVTVQGIVLDDESLTLKEGENRRLGYTVYGKSLQGNTIEWESSDKSIVEVQDGYCYPKSEGIATITARVMSTGYEHSCTIKVERNTAAVITPPGEMMVPGTSLCFASLSSDLQNRCSTVLRKPLSHLSGLSVETKQGTLYYQYRSSDDTGRGISPTEDFYLSASSGQNILDEVYFLPKPGFSGTATIRYTGYAADNESFTGTIEVPVKEQQHLTYTASAGEPLQFRGDDFNTICTGTTGRNLKHVRFSLPDASRGALYRNYISPENPGIAVRDTDTFQYNGAPALSDLYFVPAVGYEGTVTLSYTATDVNGQTFRSRVEIQVKAQRPSGDVNYTVSQGGTVTLNKEDFTALCKDFTGGTLDYIRFMDLPPASQGTLYHDYSSASRPGAAVTTGQSYYASGSPRINKVTFAAADTGAGVVAIPFQGWDTRGNNFSGQVEISIRVSSAGDLRYTADRRGEAVFDGADFNTLCKDLTGKSLHYVQFSLPAASQGALYRDRTGSSSGSKVSASQKFYYSGSPNLDKVTFVAAGGFSGTASVSFTGWNQDGTSFTGVVSVQVRDSGGDSSQVAYTLRQGKSVTFDDGPFQSLCREETGQDLREVRFALPDAAWGALYYDYKDGSGTKVTADRSYYRSRSPYLDRVSFVSGGKTGTFSIPFDGWSTGGETFAGSIKITVEENPTGPSPIPPPPPPSASSPRTSCGPAGSRG